MNSIELMNLRNDIRDFVDLYNGAMDEMTDEVTTWCSLIAVVNDVIETGWIEFVINRKGGPNVISSIDLESNYVAGLLNTALEMLLEDHGLI